MPYNGLVQKIRERDGHGESEKAPELLALRNSDG